MTPAKITHVAGKSEDPFKDFRNFLHYLFSEVRGWTVGQIQYDIADFVQNLPLCKDGIRRGQVQSMRGAGKTEIEAALALWLLYWNPDIKILVISSVLQKAQEFVALCRLLIDGSPLLADLKPHLAKDGLVEKDQKDNLHGFVVGNVTKISKELSLASFPIFGTYTGSHPDVIIADDVETPENSLTVAKRAKLLSKIYEFENLINPKGTILIQGTPQSEDSTYNHMESKGYKVRRWPSEAPALTDEVECVNVSPWIIKQVIEGKMQPGDPTYPERFDRAALEVKLATYGPTMYALQMKLNTRLADGDRYPLKLRNLIVMDLDYRMAPEAVMWGTGARLNIDPQGLPDDFYCGPASKSDKYAPYVDGVMFVDPKGRGADTVAVGVVKSLNGILYLMDVVGLATGKGNDGSAEPVLEKIAKVAFKHGIKRVAVEDNFGDGMYRKLLTPVMAKINGPTNVYDVHASGQKELRILDTLEPLIAAHRLVIATHVTQNDALMHQYTRLTRDRGSLQHDDLIEAVYGACHELADQVMLDPEKRVEQEKKAEAERMVKAFGRDAMGVVNSDYPRQTSWSRRATGRWSRMPSRRW